MGIGPAFDHGEAENDPALDQGAQARLGSCMADVDSWPWPHEEEGPSKSEWIRLGIAGGAPPVAGRYKLQGEAAGRLGDVLQSAGRIRHPTESFR